MPGKALLKKTGDRIRTDDVQLGNSGVGAQVPMAQALTMRLSAKNEGYKWVASH